SYLGQHPLAGRDVRPTDKDRGSVQVLRPAGEDAAVHQFADMLRPHAAVAEDMHRARVHSHDPVEDARVMVRVELQEDGRLVGHETRDTRPETRDTSNCFSYACPVSRVSCPSSSSRYFSKMGCFAVSFFARISSIFGSIATARLIASFVAS